MVKRVTDNVLHDGTLHAVNSARDRQVINQEHAVSMKRVNQPSDDPVATTGILKIRNGLRANHQFQENMGWATNLLALADSALNSSNELVMRAQELAIGQSSTASATPDTRIAIAKEIDELIGQMVGLANTKFADRFIFGGYQTTTNPFLADGTYRGDNRSIPVEVRDNYYISVNVPGSVPFKGLGRADGIDAFEVLQRLKTGLLKNDTIMIQSTLEDFGRVLNQFNIARASIGAKVKAIDNTMAAVLGDEIDKVKWNSELEDADAAKVFNELNKDEAILKRSMTTSSKMLQPALFDYLR